MADPGNPRNAVVSIWHRAQTTNEFLGSGAFIASDLVLTAKHLLRDKTPKAIQLRLVDGYDGIMPHKLHCHETLDIAVINLKRDFPNQQVARLDYRRDGLEGTTVDLYGVNPDSYSRDECRGYTLGTWHDEKRGYLFDHAQRKGFSGGIVVCGGSVIGIMTHRHPTEQQGLMLPLSLAADWLQDIFETRSPLSRGVAVLSGLPALPKPMPYDTFARTVKDRIQVLLQRDYMHGLCEAIVKQTGITPAADGLVWPKSASLLDALDAFYHATQSWVQQWQTPPERADRMKEGAREIFGWLVLLAVDRDRAYASEHVFDPWQNQLQLVMPLHLPAGIEVFMALLGERAAQFKETDPNKSRRYQVVGRDSFMADELENGIDPDDQLREFGRRIWVSVMKEQAPIDFDRNEFRTLNAELRGRERRDRRHYYITVPMPHDRFALTDPQFLTRLFQELSALRVLYFGDEQGVSLQLLLEDEYDLQSSIKAFHLILRDI